MENIKIFDAGRDHVLSKKVCNILGIEPGKAEKIEFKDNDSSWKINESLRGKDVYVFQSYEGNKAERFYELMLLINGLKSGACEKLTVVMPFLFGSRAERRILPKQPINSVVLANCLKAMGANAVLTVNVHTRAIGSIYDSDGMLFDNLEFEPLIAHHFAKMYQNSPGQFDFSICSPDAGGAERARYLLELMRDDLKIEISEANFCVINKYRPRPNESFVFGVVGDVERKDVIMVDDIGDTLSTMLNGAKALKQKNARRIYLSYTHAIHREDAEAKLLNALNEGLIEGVVISDSIPIAESLRKNPKIKIYSLAPLLAEGIMQIHKKGSVSILHNYNPVIEIYKKFEF